VVTLYLSCFVGRRTVTEKIQLFFIILPNPAVILESVPMRLSLCLLGTTFSVTAVFLFSVVGTL
jgi:hypothetical protein